MTAQNVWLIAALWIGLAFGASLISIWTGVSVALIEILVGVFAGNVLGIHATTEWIDFLALLGAGVLTFLAGAEIVARFDPIFEDLPREHHVSLRPRMDLTAMATGQLVVSHPYGREFARVRRQAGRH